MSLELRTALTASGTHVHAAAELGKARGRTLCGLVFVSAAPSWEWEELDPDWHCSRCWRAAEKLRAAQVDDGERR